jgi:ABC-2 type transport system ATP-binding protein
LLLAVLPDLSGKRVLVGMFFMLGCHESWLPAARGREKALPWAAVAVATTARTETALQRTVTPVLEARGICHRYGERVILKDVSLVVEPGERVALTGENGAGKSTLMRVCARLLTPQAGTLRIEGRVGYCPQIPGLHDLLNADEHLALFSPALGLSRGDAVRRGRELLSEFGFPVGERTQIRHLSGGSQQKLNLALALLGGARLLLLDEPYQGFDHGSYENFWDHVARWSADGLAVVVVTHMLQDLELVDRVVELTPHR